MIAFASIAGFVALLALAASGVFSSGGAPPAKGTSPPSGSSRQPAGTLVALPAGVVRPGTVGSDVTEIQQALTSTGHSPGVADGVYGQRTELALQSFQRSAHLPRWLPLGSLAGELFEAHPECREDLIDGFDQWEGAIRDGLQTMYKRGDLRRSTDPDRLATALLAAVQGGLVLSQIRRDVDPLEAALDTILEHIASLTTKRRSEPRRLESRR